MLPKSHIILGFLFSLIILFSIPSMGIPGFIIIWISSFMIDTDHYLFYAWLKKDINPLNSVKWFMKKHREYLKLSYEEKKKKVQIPCIFHGIEAVLLLAILYLIFKSNIFLFILAGFIFHEFLDLIYIAYTKGNFNHIISQTKNIINFRKEMKKWNKNHESII